MPDVELTQPVVGNNLLKFNQVQELIAEKQSLERDAVNPNIRDPGVVQSQLRRVTKELAGKTPVPAQGKELDYLTKREAELREAFVEGMPTQEEMRRAPPGAVGKHMAWEKRNKPKIREWQNIKLRLAAGTESFRDPDLTSVELHRPHGLSQSMNMDGAQIQGKSFFFPENIGIRNVMSESDRAELNEQRDRVVAALSEDGRPVSDPNNPYPAYEGKIAKMDPENRRQELDKMDTAEKKSYYSKHAKLPKPEGD